MFQFFFFAFQQLSYWQHTTDAQQAGEEQVTSV